MLQLAINDFKDFFQGNTTSYGQHTYGEYNEGKKEIGGKSWTVNSKLVSQEEYTSHLEGRTGLGIIPINKENKCKFIVVDIDIYDKKSEQIVISAIQERDLPFSIFFSKSRGYHLYLFFTEFIPVKEARKIVDRLIRLLSIDILCVDKNRIIEIFPKQIVLNKGQSGNWINLPYYNTKKTKQKMLYDNRELELDEALLTIKQKKLWSLKNIIEYLDNISFMDAPPCLQSIYYLNDLEANRNNFLFSFGVYFKKVNEDNFEQKLFELNRSLKYPLKEEELERTVIASIRKKGYGYKCKDDPCISYCNKTECKRRKYGIGDGKYVSELDFGQLKQIATSDPYYEWTINEKEIRFKNEDDILNQNIFRKLCMRILHYAPHKLKDPEWIKIINSALATIEVIKVDMHEDISPSAMLRNLFNEFILDLPPGNTKDQIFNGRVYNDKQKKRYLFRTKDLIDFLYVKRQFRHFTHPEIHGYLKDIEAEYTKITTETKRQVRLYAIKYAYFESIGEELKREVIDVNFTPEQIITEEKKDDYNFDNF